MIGLTRLRFFIVIESSRISQLDVFFISLHSLMSHDTFNARSASSAAARSASPPPPTRALSRTACSAVYTAPTARLPPASLHRLLRRLSDASLISPLPLAKFHLFHDDRVLHVLCRWELVQYSTIQLYTSHKAFATGNVTNHSSFTLYVWSCLVSTNDSH